MGSGSIGIACKELNKDREYYCEAVSNILDKSCQLWYNISIEIKEREETKMISDIVKTIFQQINGRQLQIMIGAKEFSQTAENELSFKIGRNCKSINRVIITYNYGTDLYTMKFCRDSFSRKTFEFK